MDNEGTDVSALINEDTLTAKKPDQKPDEKGGQGDEAAKKAAADKEAADKAAAEAQAKNKELATKFGGVAVDNFGNVVDATGKVVKTKAEIETATNEPEGVTVGDKTYRLDKDGNAVGEDGKVVHTKDELDEMAAADAPLVDEIVQKYGLKHKDERGQEKKYPDSVEGIIQYIKDNETAAEERGKQKLIESDPDFKEFIEYKKTGGTLRDFIQYKEASWSNVQFDEKNEAMLIDIIVDELVSKGIDEAQAKETANNYKDTKKLGSFAKAAYERLVKGEKDAEEARKKEFTQNQERMRQEITTHWNNVKTVVTKGDLAGITIPEADKEAFFEYISKAVNDKGESKRTVERKGLKLEQLLQLDYYQFKGFDLNELITKAAKDLGARRLRDRIKGSQNGIGGGEDSAAKQTVKSPGIIPSVDELT